MYGNIMIMYLSDSDDDGDGVAEEDCAKPPPSKLCITIIGSSPK